LDKALFNEHVGCLAISLLLVAPALLLYVAPCLPISTMAKLVIVGALFTYFFAFAFRRDLSRTRSGQSTGAVAVAVVAEFHTSRSSSALAGFDSGTRGKPKSLSEVTGRESPSFDDVRNAIARGHCVIGMRRDVVELLTRLAMPRTVRAIFSMTVAAFVALGPVVAILSVHFSRYILNKGQDFDVLPTLVAVTYGLVLLRVLADRGEGHEPQSEADVVLWKITSALLAVGILGLLVVMNEWLGATPVLLLQTSASGLTVVGCYHFAKKRRAMTYQKLVALVCSSEELFSTLVFLGDLGVEDRSSGLGLGEVSGKDRVTLRW
jgi:hypothetical protein